MSLGQKQDVQVASRMRDCPGNARLPNSPCSHLLRDDVSPLLGVVAVCSRRRQIDQYVLVDTQFTDDETEGGTR
jgi:hypothetical protein